MAFIAPELTAQIPGLLRHRLVEVKLGDLVYHQARRHQLPLLPDKDPDWMLLLLVEAMAEAAGRRVVVLVSVPRDILICCTGNHIG